MVRGEIAATQDLQYGVEQRLPGLPFKRTVFLSGRELQDFIPKG